MKITFEGKVVLITGGTHGIGRSIALLISKLGGEVIIVGRNEINAAKVIEESNQKIKFIKSDLSSEESLNSLCNYLNSEIPKIDVLINNASRNSRYSVLDTSLSEWKEMVTLNLTSSFLLSKIVAKKLKNNNSSGKIINIGAVQAMKPLQSSFSYSVVKGALISMTKSLAVDLSKFGIQTIYVMLGPIYAKAEDEVPPPDFDKRSATLLERSGRKKEIAELVAFLSSDINSFMTGSVVVADGGRIISRKPDPNEISENLFDSH